MPRCGNYVHVDDVHSFYPYRVRHGDTRGNRIRGRWRRDAARVAVRSVRCSASVSGHYDGAWLRRRKRPWHRAVCEAVRRERIRCAVARSSQFRRERRRAAAGCRSLAANCRLARGEQLYREARGRRFEANRSLGHELRRWASNRSGRDRSALAQVPTISGYEQGLRRIPPEGVAALEEDLAEDERAQLRGEPPRRQAIVSADANVPASYRAKDAISFYLQPVPEGAWENSVTVRST